MALHPSQQKGGKSSIWCLRIFGGSETWKSIFCYFQQNIAVVDTLNMWLLDKRSFSQSSLEDAPWCATYETLPFGYAAQRTGGHSYGNRFEGSRAKSGTQQIKRTRAHSQRSKEKQ